MIHLGEVSLQRRWDLTNVGWLFTVQTVFAVLSQLGRILIWLNLGVLLLLFLEIILINLTE